MNTKTNSTEDCRNTRSVRELGGEILSELDRIPDDNVHWKIKVEINELVMGVLARYCGFIIENDKDFPVEPLEKMSRYE